MNFTEIVQKQKKFFETGKTLDVRFRRQMLKQLYSAIERYADDINEALREDLGKSAFEGFMCEVGLSLSEITYMIRHLKKYSKRHSVYTPLAQFASHSYTQAVPYGNVLIMSPWNYPFLLSIEPLCDAIAAGNTVVIKPSAYSPRTSEIIERIVRECFPSEYVCVVTGGRKENSELLNTKFDMVFFTGSQAVGKEVLRHCAEYLTPAILELGGKSPCIVDKTANLALSAKRIVFGKYLNCGQTCVAPDYILCHNSVKEEFITEVKKQIKLQFGDKPLANADYGKIINEKHFNRLLGLIDKSKVVCGGGYDDATNQIEPTVMNNVTLDDAVMGEEIFGPIMPIIGYDEIREVFDIVRGGQKPLALYIFSSDNALVNKVVKKIPFGGGCVNDVIIHLATSEMGFGGVGESGMGAYHGKRGFEAFSHTKSIVDKKTFMDLPMRYQPYNKFYYKLLHYFLK